METSVISRNRHQKNSMGRAIGRVFGLMAMVCLMGQGVQAETAPAAVNVPYAPKPVLALSEKVADYQIDMLAAGLIPPRAHRETLETKGWIQGALFAGLVAIAEHSDNPSYKNVIMMRGQANQWQLGPRAYHADDHAIGMAYLWAVKHGAGADVLKPMRATFDGVLANPPAVDLAYVEGNTTCLARWCWCDALFMAPAAWIELSQQTGDPRYTEYARKEFWATTDYLYDPAERLYFRDSRFFERRGPNAEKVFWSRGNGWVFAGLARMIDALPTNDPDRARIIGIYKDMAVKLKSIQKTDGYWSPSLLADPATTLPETSGTGFFVYGFAWGIKAGILNRADYEPVVRKGWAALVRGVHPNGMLGYVQPVSDRPDSVGYDDTQYYGVGAFLLAGTAVADLKLTDPKPAAKKSAKKRH